MREHAEKPMDRHSALEKLEAEVAEAVGVQPEELQVENPDGPLCLALARQTAERENRDLWEVIEEDSRQLRSRLYPLQECLSPQEVEEFANTGQLPDERMKHLASCLGCSFLLESCEPSEEVLGTTTEKVRAALANASLQPEFPRMAALVPAGPGYEI